MVCEQNAIQAVPSACSSDPPVGAARPIEHVDVVEPRNPPSKTFLPDGSFRFVHQVKLQGAWKADSRNAKRSFRPSCSIVEYTNIVAQAWTGRVHVAEVPLVRRNLAVGVEVKLAQHELELVAREVRVRHPERHGVEREVPRRVPRVLPLVRHRDDVVVLHVEPAAVPDVAGPPVHERVRPVLLEPAGEVEQVVLLRPDHPGHRLPLDASLVLRQRRRRDGLVEEVRLAPPCSEHRVEVSAEDVAAERLHRLVRRHRGEAQLHRALAAARHLELEESGALRPCSRRVHRLAAAPHVVLVEGVLHVGRAARPPEQALVRLVLGKELRHTLVSQGALA
jgi:hypothetical protein